MTRARWAPAGGDAAVGASLSDIRPCPSSAYPSPCAYLYPAAHLAHHSFAFLSPTPATHRSAYPYQAICRQPWRRPRPSASVHSTHYILAAAHPRRPRSPTPSEKATLNGHADVRGPLQRNESMDFHTPEGTVHVSKPFRSRQTKKLRAMITFTPRKSHFDTTNERSGTNEFRVRPPSISPRALLIMIVACRGSSPCSGYLCLSSW